MDTKQTCGECGAELPANAPQGLCPRCLAGMGLGLLPTEAQPISDFVIERAGTMIGRYKLLEKIGEGGFGVVYTAEQQEPLQRKVALKIIKPGMDTREVIARFEAERQAIALMDHPNIARVLDAGATEAGRPYFVMELVRGIPITDYCDQKNLPTRERLQLFMKVCQAVQHAHQKAVIHRDIKPSNVLVTEHDGKPVPKVIDFGVAKALGQKLTEKTLFTGFQHMIGTPAYMSPEQAALSGLDIDTRADIYSLGVLLYELLTGVTPFDTDTFRKAAMDEVRRMIRETEPPKPSTRLRTLGMKLSDVATHRGTEPAGLSRLVRGDLDWIVMKCLEKDRQRRYETANGLASDVERHLGSEAVLARPPSNLYRFQKLVRRHKVAFAGTGAVAASLVIGLGVSTWLFVKEKEARQQAVGAGIRAEKETERAEAEKKNALLEANRSEKIALYLQNMLSDISPSLAKKCTKPYVQEILTKEEVRLAGELKDQPDVEAAVRTVLAGVQADMGQYDSAEANLRKVLEIRKKLFGNESPEVAASLDKLADLLLSSGKRPEAEVFYQEAITMLEQLVRENPKNQNYRQDLGHSQWRLGYSLTEIHRHETAMQVISNSLQVFEHATHDFPGNPFFRQEQAFSHRTLGDLWEELARIDQTELHYRTAIKLYAALLADTPTNAFYYAEEAWTTWVFATKLERAGQHDAAAAEYRQALALHEKAITRFPSHEDFKSRRDAVLNGLVALLNSQGKRNEAETLLREQSQDLGGRRPTKITAADEILPLIAMQDVPLTFAIGNLARQANLNFTFDPTVTNEIRGADGKVVPQTTVNIRWENLTARQALTTLLTNHSLILVEDSQTQIARITVAGAAAGIEKIPATMKLVGKPVPLAFTLPLLTGGEIELPASTNHGLLLLDFCATWCGPCRQAIPVLDKIAKDYAARGVSYVTVNQGEAPETIRRYLAKTGLEVVVALDKQSANNSREWCLMARSFQVEAIPTIVIVDQSKIIRYVQVGACPELGDKLRRALDVVLKAESVSEQSSPAPDTNGNAGPTKEKK